MREAEGGSWAAPRPRPLTQGFEYAPQEGWEAGKVLSGGGTHDICFQKTDASLCNKYSSEGCPFKGVLTAADSRSAWFQGREPSGWGTRV